MLKDGVRILWGYLGKQEALQQIANWLLLLVGAVVLARGAYMTFVDATLGLAVLGVGVVLLLAGSIDRFESLKGLGIEAKTREISKKLERADFLLEQLQQLAINVNSGLIKQAAGSRFMDAAFTEGELTVLASTTRGQLKELGISDERVCEVLRPWSHVLLWCWVCKAFAPWQKAISDEVVRLQAEQKTVIESGDRTDPRWTELPSRIQMLQRFSADTSNYLYRLPRHQLLDAVIPALRKTPLPEPHDFLGRFEATRLEWQSELTSLQQHCKLESTARWMAFIAEG